MTAYYGTHTYGVASIFDPVKGEGAAAERENRINETALKRPLKIVQVAPDVYPIPPENYGGIERVMYDLIEEIVKRGHKVYLYAPAGSKTSASLIPYRHLKPWNQMEIIKYVKETLPDSVDIIHDHTHASVIGRINLPIPTVCTEHFSANCPVKYPVYCSRTVLERFGGNRGFCVHHGINMEEFEFSSKKEDYLFYIGKIDASKGPHYAIEAAERLGKMLLLAGPVHDQDFYRKKIEPCIKSNPNIHYIGEVGGRKKQDLLKYAGCVLFPTLCEESFGLVAVEAMACGTPVLAFPSGAVPEILQGFPNLVCKDVDDMVKEAFKGDFPDPRSLKEYVEVRFTSRIMTEKYLELYAKVIEKESCNSKLYT